MLLTTKFLRFCIPESFAVRIVTGLNVEAEVEVDHDPDVVALVMATYVVTVTIPSADLVNLKPIANFTLRRKILFRVSTSFRGKDFCR